MFSRTFLSISYRISVKSNVTIQKITCCRYLHLTCRNIRKDFVLCTGTKYRFQLPFISATFIRRMSESSVKTKNASSDQAINFSSDDSTIQVTVKAQADEIISQIPEPPAPVQDVVEIITKEPTLQDLGLGSWWPPGMIQQFLDFLHTSVGLPWWGTIVLTTVCARIIMFPLVIRIQKYTAKMHNVQPQIQQLQVQLSEARKMRDQMEVARLSYELYEFMKQEGVNPLTNAGLPLMQAPVFLSFFWGLRGMVQVPVESMKEGGMLWFTDLTAPDPYYLLPIMTSTTLFITLEVGTDSVRVESMGNIRHVLRLLPAVMFPFIMNFEGAILCYWVSTNLFSLIQVSILRIPKVRTYFNIPPLIKHDKNKLPITKQKFMEGFKDSWTNMKVAREMNSRALYDETVFEQAGRGPIPKTYKFDPTKSTPVVGTILSKKRD